MEVFVSQEEIGNTKSSNLNGTRPRAGKAKAFGGSRKGGQTSRKPLGRRALGDISNASSSSEGNSKSSGKQKQRKALGNISNKPSFQIATDQKLQTTLKQPSQQTLKTTSTKQTKQKPFIPFADEDEIDVATRQASPPAAFDGGIDLDFLRKSMTFPITGRMNGVNHSKGKDSFRKLPFEPVLFDEDLTGKKGPIQSKEKIEFQVPDLDDLDEDIGFTPLPQKKTESNDSLMTSWDEDIAFALEMEDPWL